MCWYYIKNDDVFVMRKSEKAVLAIGTINVFLLLLASSLIPDGKLVDTGSLMLIFVHIFIIAGAFPILYRAIIGPYTISKNFTIIFTFIAILSALLVIIGGSITTWDSDDIFFVGLAIIELLPLGWLYIKKRHVIWQPAKKLPFDLGQYD